MTEKACKKCGEIKPLTEFHKHPNMADGRLSKCKVCKRDEIKANRAARPDHYAAYRKKWVQNNPEKMRRYTVNYINKKPHARAAHHLVQDAIRTGRLTKPDTCSACGAGGTIHGHHADYFKPLEVEWLCARCHKALHSDPDQDVLT